MGICEEVCVFMKKYMGIHGSLWASMGSYGQIWVFIGKFGFLLSMGFMGNYG